MTSHLVEISRRFSGHNYWGPGAPSFEVQLTAAGRQLVSAWKGGDPEAIREALKAGADSAQLSENAVVSALDRTTPQ